MTNEELQTAINDCAKALDNASSASERHGALLTHLKELLQIQMVRARMMTIPTFSPLESETA